MTRTSTKLVQRIPRFRCPFCHQRYWTRRDRENHIDALHPTAGAAASELLEKYPVESDGTILIENLNEDTQ